MTEDKKMPAAENNPGNPSGQEEVRQTAPQSDPKDAPRTKTPARSPRTEQEKEGANAPSQSGRPEAVRNDNRPEHTARPDKTAGRAERPSADRKSEDNNRASQTPVPDGRTASERTAESGDGNTRKSSDGKSLDRNGASRDAGNRPLAGSDRNPAASDTRNANHRSGKSGPAGERKSSDRTTGSGGRNTAKSADRKPLDRSVKPLDRSVKPHTAGDRNQSGSRKPNGESRVAGRNRTASNVSAPKSGGRRTWREYALQLLVVIVGVVVTLIGSGLVGRWQEQRKVRSVMQLVHAELETNAREMNRVCRSLDHDRRGMALLHEYGMDYRKIPVDSLEEYRFLLSETEEFRMQDDALELLRSSGMIASVDDRKMLFEVLGCYSFMKRFRAAVDNYNNRKLLSLNHLLAAGFDGSMAGSDAGESWRVMMDDPMCSAFFGRMGNWFGTEALQGGAVARIGRTAGMLNEKYGFE